MKLREALAKAYKQRFTRSLEQPMKLRPHVAESNMDENRHDELKEQYARENLSILLDALEEWDFRNKLHGYKVLLCAAPAWHQTSMTLTWRQSRHSVYRVQKLACLIYCCCVCILYGVTAVRASCGLLAL